MTSDTPHPPRMLLELLSGTFRGDPVFVVMVISMRVRFGIIWSRFHQGCCSTRAPVLINQVTTSVNKTFSSEALRQLRGGGGGAFLPRA